MKSIFWLTAEMYPDETSDKKKVNENLWNIHRLPQFSTLISNMLLVLTQMIIIPSKIFKTLAEMTYLYEFIPYSILCKEKFYDFLVKFSNRKYTKRCAVSSATTYIKFRLESLNLIIHSRVTLKIDDRNCILIFFEFDVFP